MVHPPSASISETIDPQVSIEIYRCIKHPEISFPPSSVAMKRDLPPHRKDNFRLSSIPTDATLSEREAWWREVLVRKDGIPEEMLNREMERLLQEIQLPL